jgi:uncharacterized protein (DUF362 family)
MHGSSRRELLRLGAGAAAGLGAARLLTACGGEKAPTPPARSPTPTPLACTQAEAGRTARVAAVRGTDLADMTRSALAALGGIQTVVHEGETVFIKPNMVTLPWSARDYNPFRLGECTKPEIVVAVAEECLRAGARQVIVGDGSQMPRFDWSGAVTLDGSTNLAREAARLNSQYRGQVRLVCLDADTPEWVEIPTGISLGRVAVSSLVTRADRVISIPVAKTHRWAYLTLALKNFIGITPLARYGWTGTSETTRVLLHRNDYTPRGFGRLLVDIASAVRPHLSVIDFSIGMEGNGPSQSTGGRAVDMRTRLGSWLVLASTDPVAADATAARVMNLEAPFAPEILTMARDAGLGVLCAPSIELLGARLDDLRVQWTAAQPAV